MVKPTRALLFVSAALLVLAVLPLATTLRLKTQLLSAFGAPLAFSRAAAGLASDLWHFRGNAAEARRLRAQLAALEARRFYDSEALLENRRLSKLLGLKAATPPSVKRLVPARVIGRSPATWNRVLLVDKGTKDGVHPNMLVLADVALAGKVIEAAPSVAKVLLVTDPSLRVGAIVQRSRQQGILYGALSGECRLKTMSAEADVKEGDVIETAGFGGFFPKGLRIGTVKRVWREPGQIYKVAEVRPTTDLNRVEEVVCVE